MRTAYKFASVALLPAALIVFAATTDYESRGRMLDQGKALANVSLAKLTGKSSRPETVEVYSGLDRLNRTHAKLAALSRPNQERSDVLSIVLVGDSWTDTKYGFEPYLTRMLREKFGDAGDGFIPVYRSGTMGLELTARGTYDAPNTALEMGPTPSASLAVWSSSDTETPFRVTYKASKPQDQALLHSIGNGAVVRYRKDGGDWTELQLSGDTVRIDDLSQGGRFSTVDVELVSGRVTILGIEGRLDRPGVRVHNIGVGSATMEQALSCPEDAYVSSLAAMSPDLIINGWGTNESIAGQSPDKFIHDVGEMLARFRKAAPNAEFLLWSEARSLVGVKGELMREYSTKLRAYAEEKGIANMDGQALFGESPADYGDNGKQLMGNLGGGRGDNFHPTSKGYQLLADGFYRALSDGVK